MAAVESTMLPLGTAAPDFTLPDVATGRPVSMSTYRAGRPLLVMFICNHCPYVKYLRQSLSSLCRDAQARGLAVLAISSNDAAAYPADGPEKMIQEAADAGYTFPYLYDESQDIAKHYTAACTPDFFLFNASGTLAYRGQFDSSRPKGPSAAIPITGEDLRLAIDAVLAGQPAPSMQRPSIGCNIKWKPGNAPAYYSVG